MNTEDYLALCNKHPDDKNQYPGWEKDLEDIKQFNRELLRKYSWLTPTNAWSGKKITDCCGPDGEKGFWPGNLDGNPEYDYEYTWLDDMPTGWRLAFGDQMVEEINQELIKYNFVDDYRITQIKEKYGSLRWYDNGTPIGKLSESYEDISWRPSEHNGKCQPDYDARTQVLRDNGCDHYISFFDRANLDMTNEEISRYNEGAVFYYKLYEIVEKCELYDIISKYEKLSYRTCIKCGKPAKWISRGWISPYCTDCAKKIINKDISESTLSRYFDKIEKLEE